MFQNENFVLQLDFGHCNLTFTQVIVYGEPVSGDPLTLGYIERYANLEVGINKTREYLLPESRITVSIGFFVANTGEP